MSDRICSVENCERPFYGRGFCTLHWQRWRKHGSTDKPVRKPWKQTPEAKAKMAASKVGAKNPMYGKTGSRHHNWTGDEVGYYGVHDWMSHHFGQPKHCEQCGTTDPDKRYEWANISGEYRRERSDFKRLCKKCHNDHDSINVWQVAPSRRNKAMKIVNGKPVSSKYKGVRASGYGTWRATLKVGNKIKNLGTFKTEEEAARAYNAAVLEAHGTDAFLNEVA